MHGEVERPCKNCEQTYIARSSKSLFCCKDCMLKWNYAHLPTGERQCNHCKQSRPINHFRLMTNYGLYDWKCKSCKFTLLPIKEKKRRQEKLRNSWYQRTYGVEIEDYERMYKEQKGLCKICKRPEAKRRLSIDHCHVSREVRGLLCQSCNLGLGAFKDNGSLLIAAIKYLKQEEELDELLEKHLIDQAWDIMSNV